MKTWIAAMVVMMWLGAIGCAEQKAAPAPSQRKIQADSDRFFDTMKQEEHDHGTVPEKRGAGDGY
jgi:hypothetical protein